MSATVLQAALHDADPAVRRHAIRLSEPLLTSSSSLADELLKLEGDADPQVRLQLAFTLGEWKDARAGDLLADVLATNKDDRFITTAAISSINKTNLPTLARRIAAAPPSTDVFVDVLKTSTAIDEASDVLVAAMTAPKDGHYAPWQFEALAETGCKTPAADAMRAAANNIVADESAATDLRVAAIGVVDDVDLLAKLISPTCAPEIQQAAMHTLSALDARVFLTVWTTLAPPLRATALDALLSRPEWTQALLDAIEARRIAAVELDAPHRQRLLQDESSKDRAAKLLAETVKPDRQKVLDTFKPATALSGDASHGGAIFTKTCATCHQLGDIGKTVGPDLASLGNKSSDALLVAIIDPNRAVETRFLNYVATLKDGQVLTGLLSAETSTSITLLGSDAKPQQILRSSLKSLRSQGISLMPEGLETGLSPQDLADLFAFVRSAQSSGTAPSP
jgi:putative heme-binding domain-containing protein